jgi:hypothetical protein
LGISVFKHHYSFPLFDEHNTQFLSFFTGYDRDSREIRESRGLPDWQKGNLFDFFREMRNYFLFKSHGLTPIEKGGKPYETLSYLSLHTARFRLADRRH